MAPSTIPADPRNPGQVFACLGIVEIAEILIGPTESFFDTERGRFTCATAGIEQPIPRVIQFLAQAQATEVKSDGDDPMARPIILSAGGAEVPAGHWADASSREKFKLYAGNRSACKIARDMLDVLRSLAKRDQQALHDDPWNALAPMAGSFNFDPRGAWTAPELGFNPNKHQRPDGNVLASPAVEVCAAVGLEHARPQSSPTHNRRFRYALWQEPLPVPLARAVLGVAVPTLQGSLYSFELLLAGKNKIVTFADQEAFSS